MPTTHRQTSRKALAKARRAGLGAALLLFAAAAAPSPAAAVEPAYEASSADGASVFFSSDDQLVPGDTDNRRDVYVRSFDVGAADYVTRVVSTGPTGGNNAFDVDFEKASSDGSKVFFTTYESLVSTDTDNKLDVYVRAPDAGTTALVSVAGEGCGASCGNGPADASFAGATASGSIAFFVTTERFSGTDSDSAVDIYARNLGTGVTSYVSAGPGSCSPTCGNEAWPATLRGVPANGSRAFFTTYEQLTPDDTDNDIDLYERSLPSGPTTRVSLGASGGNASSSPANFEGTSSDGSKVFFETIESLVAGDTDAANDVYRRSAGNTVLVSAGTGPDPANLKAHSSDGTQVLFETVEPLTGADTNGASDVYSWSGGAPTLITSGTCKQGTGCGASFSSAAADAGYLFFTTTEKLAAADTDSSADLYRVATTGVAVPLLVSAGAGGCAPGCGNGGFDSNYAGSSADGAGAYFSTVESLDPVDADSIRDLYFRDLAGATTTLSTPAGTCPVGGNCAVLWTGNSTDGEHVFFVTEERLDPDDVDSETDVYERDQSLEPAQTRLVSGGNTVVVAPEAPILTGTSPASPGSSTSPALLGQAQAGTSIKIYTTGNCTEAPIATGTAAQLQGAGIAVTVSPGSTTSFRATATDEDGDTSTCSAAITYTHSEKEQEEKEQEEKEEEEQEEKEKEEENNEQPPPPPPPPPPPLPEGGDTGTGGGTGTRNDQPKFYDGGTPFVAPLTRITFGPSFKTKKRKAVFRFVDSTGQPGTRFSCRLDRQRWKGCGSPVQIKKLKPGKHTFNVKGQNASGVWEARPVKRAFKVVTG